MPTLFELKQNMATIGEQVAKIDKELTAKAIDPKATREDIQTLQTQKADMQARFDVIKAQHDEVENKKLKDLGIIDDAAYKKAVTKIVTDIIK